MASVIEDAERFEPHLGGNDLVPLTNPATDLTSLTLRRTSSLGNISRGNKIATSYIK